MTNDNVNVVACFECERTFDHCTLSTQGGAHRCRASNSGSTSCTKSSDFPIATRRETIPLDPLLDGDLNIVFVGIVALPCGRSGSSCRTTLHDDNVAFTDGEPVDSNPSHVFCVSTLDN
jgi:hypothetical protein